MVGFVYNPTVIEEEEEEEGNLNQPLELKKSNDPLDVSFPELEDFSISFLDSLLNFDDWVEEKPDPSMADLIPADYLGKVEVLEKSMEIGEEVPFKETSIGDDGLGKIGKLGSLIEEEMGKVTLEGEIVGVSGNGVGCDNEKNGETVGVVGDGVKSNEVLSVDGNGVGCDNEKNVETLGVVGDGIKSNEVLSVDGNGLENDDKLTFDKKKGETVSDGDESDGNSESESASSYSSSSSSSSSDDDDDEEEEMEKEEKVVEVGEDMEEGEIRDFKGEEMVAWSDDEDDGGGAAVTGPIRSKNELQVINGFFFFSV